jgi:hypothetical protein
MTKTTMMAAVGAKLTLTAFAWNASAAFATTPWALLEDTVHVVLESVNGTEASGAMHLQAVADDQTEIVIELAQLPGEQELVVLLYTGSCEEPGEMAASLGAIQVAADGTGSASAVVSHSLAELLQAAASVQVATSDAASPQALLCGEMAEESEAPVPAEADTEQEDTETEG